jgi:AraC family ethanolamine operon transcriptional activator
MSTFRDGVRLREHFDDFDSMAAALHGWNMEYARVGAGSFSAYLDYATTAEMQILRFSTDNSLLMTGMTPKGSAGVGFVVSAAGGVRSLGRNIAPATTAPSRLRSSEVHMLTNGPLELVVLATDQALFERYLWARLRKDGETLGADWLVRTPPGVANCTQRGQALQGLLSVLSSDGLTSDAAKHRLQECALHIVLDGLETDPACARTTSLALRRRIARAAEEVLRSRLDDPPSLSELCETLQVCERTLHAAFQEGFGLAPKAYLRALRLSAVHRRLRCGTEAVTDAATALGFFHFGRFAGEYRAMFGESPSETLRRARGLGAH